MATYFINPYDDYYNKLKAAAGIVSDSETLIEKITFSSQLVKTLKSQLQSSTWKELGYEELVSTALPGAAANVQTVADNIADGLKVACSIAINELLPKVEQLKQEDEIYESIVNQLNSLPNPPPAQYDKDGKETQEYRDYKSSKDELESQRVDAIKNCISFQDEANTIADSIKALDGAVTAIKETSIPSTSAYVIDDGSGNLITVNYNGEEYYIVNTKLSVLEYAEYVQKNRMYQNAGALPGQCMIASQIYARDLLTGRYSSYKDFINQEGSPATRINERAVSQNKNDILAYVYDEVTSGNPCVLQVTQQKTATEGLRHLVTVVGFSKNVSSASELTEADILVLDNVDGKIQTLAERNRQLYNQGGKGYQALGPTDTFLAKEVQTVTTSA